jgi:hypothetical protein
MEAKAGGKGSRGVAGNRKAAETIAASDLVALSRSSGAGRGQHRCTRDELPERLPSMAEFRESVHLAGAPLSEQIVELRSADRF